MREQILKSDLPCSTRCQRDVNDQTCQVHSLSLPPSLEHFQSDLAPHKYTLFPQQIFGNLKNFIFTPDITETLMVPEQTQRPQAVVACATKARGVILQALPNRAYL